MSGEELQDRIKKALQIAFDDGATDGGHHKMWVIDQMVGALTGCPPELVETVDYRGAPYSYYRQGESEEYREWVRRRQDGPDGPDSYEWKEGTPP